MRVRLDQDTSFGGLPSVQMMSMRFGLMLVREMLLFDSVLFILIQPDAPIKSGSAPIRGVDIFTTEKKMAMFPGLLCISHIIGLNSEMKANLSKHLLSSLPLWALLTPLTSSVSSGSQAQLQLV